MLALNQKSIICMEALLMHGELKYEMAKLLCLLFLVSMIILLEEAFCPPKNPLTPFWKKKGAPSLSLLRETEETLKG